MNITSLSDHEYRRLLKREISLIKNNMVSRKNTLVLSSGMVTQDSVQSYLAYSKDSVVSHLISESLIRSELKVSDSAEHCLEIIVNILDSMLKSVHHVDSVKEMIKEYSSQVESAISFIMENTEKINREKYKNLLIQKIKNKELRDKIYDTVNLAGISKKVSLEKSNGIALHPIC